MKQKFFILFLVIAVFVPCKAEKNTDETTPAKPQEVIKNRISYTAFPDSFVEFSDFKNFYMVLHANPESDGDVYKGTYTLDIRDHITFVNANLDNGKKERFLLLANNTIGELYGSDGNRVAFGMTGGVNRANIIDGIENVKASSYLKENGISYLPENLNFSNKKTDMPWVEGVDGYGIGEKLFFSGIGGSFHISIGYVSYKKPYLYTQNSRPKTIKLSVEGKPSFVVELKDTPHYQQVMLPKSFNGETIVLEIMDVYPGTKYKDTCINNIIGDPTDPKNFTIYEYWEK